MKRSTWGPWILFVLTLPMIIGWLFPLLMVLIGAAKFSAFRFEKGLVLTTVWRAWAAKRWRFSTTICRGIVYQEGARDETKEANTRIERHEHVHIRQFEDATVVGLVAGLLAWVAPSHIELALVWIFSPFLMGFGWLTAWLRGGDPYLDAEMEKHAHAETDDPHDHG